jgi:8-oxo-dGTP diphosphatase
MLRTMPDRERLLLYLAVDLVILTVRENLLQVLIVERAHDPFQEKPALPGGFLQAGEDLQVAAKRELAEETSIDGSAFHLEQLATYGTPDRDTRGRVVSVAYLAIAPDLPIPTAGSDARAARWAPAGTIRGTPAFDHDGILDDAVERARARLEYTTLAAAFWQPTFTSCDMRKVYEAVWDVPLDPRNFSRKVIKTEGFIVPARTKRVPETGRPAALYRRGPAQSLYPPILRNGAG